LFIVLFFSVFLLLGRNAFIIFLIVRGSEHIRLPFRKRVYLSLKLGSFLTKRRLRILLRNLISHRKCHLLRKLEILRSVRHLEALHLWLKALGRWVKALWVWLDSLSWLENLCIHIHLRVLINIRAVTSERLIHRV